MLPIRVLLLADSHIGFDLPARQRSPRRARGRDFLANYAAALAPALRGEVDVVVHGGDVFDRPEVDSSVAWQALEPLVRVADRGIPVVLVPGNHERGRLPHERFAAHPRVHVLERPRTVLLPLRGRMVALSGFASERDVRTRFASLLDATGWRASPADHRLLCLHQCVEGATVGPADYTFTTASDVIRGTDLPAGFDAVVSGHIHRHQVLTHDLRGRALPSPVVYPGSIERTSVAEAGEEKGYVVLELGETLQWRFQRLHARPMIVREIIVAGRDDIALDARVRAIIEAVPLDAVLRLRIRGDVRSVNWQLLSAPRLRTLAPRMSIDVRSDDEAARFRRPRVRPRVGALPAVADPQLDLHTF
jgi:DNA repair protein SbcD/Mre11